MTKSIVSSTFLLDNETVQLPQNEKENSVRDQVTHSSDEDGGSSEED